MGLLDSVLGAATQALGNQAADEAGGADWVGLVSGLLQGGEHGGLAGIVRQLQAGGLGEQLQSWISTGANQAVTGGQISSALGGDLIGKLAAAAGVSHEEASAQLSQLLPQLVDHLSPDGQLPEAGGLGQLLGQLLQR
ncbi:MAG TPA: YidB family protein [Burkholderiaceae bacterium]